MQISISNPSTKPIQYDTVIAGEHAEDFAMAARQSGTTVPPRAHVSIDVEFRSRFVAPVHGVLILVPRRTDAAGTSGNTLIFNLKGVVNSATSQVSIATAQYCTTSARD